MKDTVIVDEHISSIENYPEVGSVSNRSGVYKISMVRMFYKELTKQRMYGSKFELCRNAKVREIVAGVAK
ncbi:predicted protein [Enterococcus faecium 1,230,933]|nr:predicted protein [Enterococcus faecium 1,230,933]